MMFCTPSPTPKICQYDVQNIQRLHRNLSFFGDELLTRCEVEERRTENFWSKKLWTWSWTWWSENNIYLFFFILAHQTFLSDRRCVIAPISRCFCSCDREGNVLYLMGTQRETEGSEKEEILTVLKCRLWAAAESECDCFARCAYSFWLMLKSILVVWVK